MSAKARDDAEDPVTVGRLIEDLRTVVRDAEALLRATEGQAGENLADIRARAEESLNHARERLRDAGAGVETSAREAAQSAGRHVREHPWTAVAVAAGIGFLLGQLGRRR
jgi:ElaB/YqjD/DUF883 family membrane-anchored ribosome-binding protein